MYRHERMSNEFEKFHLNDGTAPWPFHPVIHHFTAPDIGGPHDHPWAFQSYVLQGGYVERVYHVHSDGSWSTELIHRKPGTAHYVPATHIHEIVSLPEGECWTMVMAHETERETRFWQFDDKIKSRAWHEQEYMEHASSWELSSPGK